ncbi:MAG: hypothetical protein Q8L21_01145 [Candidatus Komeilibacteria bacterium]|nr:hypothetical protein [Candidatus Komeilibacteria bacterium]
MKKLLMIVFLAALAILLSGCAQAVGTTPLPSGDGETSEPICDMEFTFMYEEGKETQIIYHSLSNTGSSLVKLRRMNGEGDVNGEPLDSACLGPSEEQKHGVRLDNEMWISVEVWWGEQCSPVNKMEPCYRNGARIYVKHTPSSAQS